MRLAISSILSFLLLGVLGISVLVAQQSNRATATESKGWSTEEDHQNMMDQLGIKKLRRGRDADENSPHAANYDERLANPFPNLPGVLTLKNEKKSDYGKDVVGTAAA